MSTGLLVRPKELRIAESARTVRPGELLVLDSHGREVTKRARTVNQVKLGVVAGFVMGVPLTVLGVTGVPAGLLAGGIIGTALWIVRRTTRPYVQAQEARALGTRDDAQVSAAMTQAGGKRFIGHGSSVDGNAGLMRRKIGSAPKNMGLIFAAGLNHACIFAP